ncbi:phosphate signaling complex protein PhoU [Virgibacillus phasianinus]|uniref:phosphate signaling complex protein PhoU n=1 Tax=Virgibacillus phasianinus TaxID=2017483 RepID=UPI0015608570|nr:phosphate signaling complex protein PhoU [Virgibacillus phasianinus]
MLTRESFEEQLITLKSELMELGDLAKFALDQSIQALENQNVDLALQVIDEDAKINLLEEEIDEHATWLIAKEQPLASDLRKNIAVMKVTTDIERIGDLAVNIAKSVIRIGKSEFIEPLNKIPKMALMAQEMIDCILKAFNEEDIYQAREIAEKDDEVDKMYGGLVAELMELMTKNPTYVAQIIQLSFICRYLERVADHATNISEAIIYLVKGKRYDLNK